MVLNHYYVTNPNNTTSNACIILKFQYLAFTISLDSNDNLVKQERITFTRAGTKSLKATLTNIK